ncbi:Polygalacturonase [Sesamum angolense]|uniref:Polygalacturonase n=1 Tax=Sesamum angolense TaxID=2727404 RepID=A0AAE1XD43_9LAMI|nr:Polygalacturonase [Sesamum angolense]
MDAWKEASNSTSPSIIVIPRGTWSLSQVKLIGNKAPLELQVQGTVQTNPKTCQLPNKDGEWITINYVNYFTLCGGGVFDGQGQEAWKQNDCHKNRNCAKLPMNLSFNFINNSIIRDVTTKDSKNFHVNCISSHNVTFLRFTISAPGDSPNTDGIHLGRDTMINVIDSVIQTGDDCVSIGDETKEVRIQNGPVTYDITKYGAKPGADISQALMDAWKEASNSTSPSTIVIPRGTWSLSQVKLIGNKAPLELQVQGTVQANPKTGRDTMINVIDSVIKTGDDCVSIGDETKVVRIQNVTCGPGHGISVGSLGGVKTWPSAPAQLTVSDLHFEDLIMDNVSSPIIIDQEYCPHNLCKKDRPSSIKITNVSIKNVRGTTNSAEAVTLICSSLKPCENVEVGDVDLTYNGNQGPITTKCSNVKPKFVGKQNPPVCATTAKSA